MSRKRSGAVGARERDLEIGAGLLEPRELLHVVRDACAVALFLVCRREVLRIAMQQVERALFGKRREQRLANAVLPTADRRRELAFERGDVRLTLLGHGRPHRHREPRKRGLGDHELAFDGAAVEPREQDVLDRAPRA